jgi:uncharacterized membrane protein YphA (DoxX/SURF4 family)
MRAFLERLRPFAPLVLRLAVAALFCAYGGRLAFKQMGDLQTAVAAWSLPRWMGYSMAWTVLAGGAFIGLGFLARLAAFLCAACIALLLVKTRMHGWQSLDLPLLSLSLAACLSLVLSGAGRLSIDRRLFSGA